MEQKKILPFGPTLHYVGCGCPSTWQQGTRVADQVDALVLRTLQLFQRKLISPNRPLRVCYMLPHHNITGGMKCLVEHVRLLRQRGHYTIAVHRSDTAQRAMPPWTTVEADVDVVCNLHQRLSDVYPVQNIDVVVVGIFHQVAELLAGVQAPVVYWEQGHEWIFGDPIRLQVAQNYLKQDQLFHQVMHLPCVLAAVSSAVQDILQQEFGRSSLLIPNGIDCQRFTPGPWQPAPGSSEAQEQQQQQQRQWQQDVSAAAALPATETSSVVETPGTAAAAAEAMELEGIEPGGTAAAAVGSSEQQHAEPPPPAAAAAAAASTATDADKTSSGSCVMNGIWPAAVDPAPPPAASSSLCQVSSCTRTAKRRVLLVGNPALPLKGFPAAVAALAAVSALLPIKVRWVCQVAPTAAHIPHLAAADLDLETVVSPGQAELPGLYRGHDVFLFTSRYEAWGMPVLEAMATGLPVVTTDCFGTRTFCQHGHNSLVAEPDDVAGIAQHVLTVLTNPGLQARLSEAGRQTALQYTPDKVLEDLEAVLYCLTACAPELLQYRQQCLAELQQACAKASEACSRPPASAAAAAAAAAAALAQRHREQQLKQQQLQAIQHQRQQQQQQQHVQLQSLAVLQQLKLVPGPSQQQLLALQQQLQPRISQMTQLAVNQELVSPGASLLMPFLQLQQQPLQLQLRPVLLLQQQDACSYHQGAAAELGLPISQQQQQLLLEQQRQMGQTGLALPVLPQQQLQVSGHQQQHHLDLLQHQDQRLQQQQQQNGAALQVLQQLQAAQEQQQQSALLAMLQGSRSTMLPASQQQLLLPSSLLQQLPTSTMQQPLPTSITHQLQQQHQQQQQHILPTSILGQQQQQPMSLMITSQQHSPQQQQQFRQLQQQSLIVSLPVQSSAKGATADSSGSIAAHQLLQLLQQQQQQQHGGAHAVQSQPQQQQQQQQQSQQQLLLVQQQAPQQPGQQSQQQQQQQQAHLQLPLLQQQMPFPQLLPLQTPQRHQLGLFNS